MIYPYNFREFQGRIFISRSLWWPGLENASYFKFTRFSGLWRETKADLIMNCFVIFRKIAIEFNLDLCHCIQQRRDHSFLTFLDNNVFYVIQLQLSIHSFFSEEMSSKSFIHNSITAFPLSFFSCVDHHILEVL